MKTIQLLRHGKVEGPAALYGKTDVALSAEGEAQLQRATQHLCKPDLIISSPLQRCRTFAEQHSAKLNCELTINQQIREMDFGLWDGAPYSEHSPHWEEMTKFWREPAKIAPPGGEALQQMQARVDSAWHELVDTPAQNIWVISHGGVIRIILAKLLNLDWRNPQLYSTLAISYASRSTISISYFEGKATTSVQAIAIPTPER